jgi:hypothetical protein
MKCITTVLAVIISFLGNSELADVPMPLIKTKTNQQHINQYDMDNSLMIEQTEIAAWRDLIDAAPDSFKITNGLRHKDIGGGMAIDFQKEPVPLFNRVIGLGLEQPLSQDVIDEIKGFYTHHEKYLVHYSIAVKPVNADSLLKQNGFYLAGHGKEL